MQRAVVVLPQPLSPTRPSVSPSASEKLTSSTARTWPTTRRSTPFLIEKYFFRLRTSRIGALSEASPLADMRAQSSSTAL